MHDMMQGKNYAWTVEIFNIRQFKMETGWQMKKNMKNLLKTAEDQRRKNEEDLV